MINPPGPTNQISPSYSPAALPPRDQLYALLLGVNNSFRKPMQFIRNALFLLNMDITLTLQGLLVFFCLLQPHQAQNQRVQGFFYPSHRYRLAVTITWYATDLSG